MSEPVPSSHDGKNLELSKLRRTLAMLYEDPTSARRIVKDAGIPSGAISFAGGADNVWFSILEEATKHDAVVALVQVASAEYPKDSVLIEMLQENAGEQQPSDTQPQHQPPSAPNPFSATLAVRGAQFVGRAAELRRLKGMLQQRPLTRSTLCVECPTGRSRARPMY